MDNVEEMDKFLEKYNFPKLNQQEIENLNRPITSMDIEESLHPWDKVHLVMVYDPVNVLLYSDCQNFGEDFCIYVHQ